MNARRQDVLLALVIFAIGTLLVRLTSPPYVTVTWETASEVDAAGFHLYRSPSPGGPFEPATSKLIPAKGDPLTGASYTYEDKAVRWGTRYYYQLEEVTLNGSTTRYPETVQSRAGLGWGWVLAIGLGMAVMSLLVNLWPIRPSTQGEEVSSDEDASENGDAAL